MRIGVLVGMLGVAAAPASLYADTGDRAGTAGVSGLWILANFCYAGMRAQANPSSFWRVVSFIFGFPGTVVSLFAIEEGSERVYGVDVPRAPDNGDARGAPPDAGR